METDPRLRDELRTLSVQEFAGRYQCLFLGVSVATPGDPSEDAGFDTFVGDPSGAGDAGATMLAPLAKREGANGYSFITVGRAGNNDIVLRVPGVSKCHVVFNELEDGGHSVTDAGSTYGTTVNGRTLEPNHPAPVRVGDTISLASSVTIMLLDAATAHTWFRVGG